MMFGGREEMNVEGPKAYVTYIYPLMFVVHEGEEIDYSIDEINNLSYDHSLLHRIVGTISNCFGNKKIDYLICGDAAIGIQINEDISEDDVLLHYNDLLCKLLLGGMQVEAVTNKDIVKGCIYASKSIWPVDFGESWNSHVHAELRMKVAGVTDAILLYHPQERTITLEEIKNRLEEGTRIVSAIPNLSTFHLIHGITELKYRNWSSSLTYLWIIVEEITDYLWTKNIVDKVDGLNSKKRRENLRDTRSYTIAVKQEFLLQVGVFNIDIYNDLFSIRQARNKLIHEGVMISESKATLLYDSIMKLLNVISL